MEAYIIIISAAITAIAYLLLKGINTNNSSLKIFPMVLKDGNYVLSFPIVSSDIDPINATKVYLKIKEIGSIDVDTFANISNIIDWHSIISSVINNTPIVQPDFSSLSNVKLYNDIIIECVIESETPKKVHIQINTDLTINILKN